MQDIVVTSTRRASAGIMCRMPPPSARQAPRPMLGRADQLQRRGFSAVVALLVVCQLPPYGPPPRQVELAENGVHVVLDRGRTDRQLAGDLLVGQAIGDHPRDF